MTSPTIDVGDAGNIVLFTLGRSIHRWPSGEKNGISICGHGAIDEATYGGLNGGSVHVGLSFDMRSANSAVTIIKHVQIEDGRISRNCGRHLGGK